MASNNPFDTLKDEFAEVVRNVVRIVVREELHALRTQEPEPQPVLEEEEEDRLVGRKEIARRLDLTPDTVSAKMGKGELIWTIDPISGQRKMKKSTLDQYIRDLPEYTGLLSAKKEAVA
nr:MAG TPA: excisionase [Caudoviricetes sp.]